MSNDPPIGREAVVWAIRLFLGREPRDEAEVEAHQGHADLAALRSAFLRMPECQRLPGQAYAAPLFLLEPSAVPGRFAPPTLADPVCQLCTAAQLAEPEFATACAALGLRVSTHRKTWEFAWIAAVLRRAGLLRPGLRALGFGVGREPLPAWLARHGVAVLATDAPAGVAATQGWATSGQQSAGIDDLLRPEILPNEEARALIRFHPVDMNAIPGDLAGFDVCWSACALEHLGSLDHGMRFVEASLATLRPGGLAVHTTEFNLSSNDATVSTPMLSIYRKRDIEALLRRLIDAGHEPWPLNLHPGSGPLDEHVDVPPFGPVHLKVAVGRFATTSIGIVVRKGGS